MACRVMPRGTERRSERAAEHLIQRCLHQRATTYCPRVGSCGGTTALSLGSTAVSSCADLIVDLSCCSTEDVVADVAFSNRAPPSCGPHRFANYARSGDPEKGEAFP
jgi:hypothetical protein